MRTEENITDSTGSPAAIMVRPSLRASAGTLLLGGLIFLAGVSRPVVSDWAAAWEDEAQRIALAVAQPGQFRLGFVLMGIGFIVMGLALGLWGRAISTIETGRRRNLAKGAGLAAAIGGFGPGVERIVLPLIDLDQAASGGWWIGAAGAGLLSLGFVVFGVMSWRGPAPKWAGIGLALTGLAGAATIPAFYMFGAIGFGLVGVVVFRRSWGQHTS